jgi:hypothetical protein
MSYINSLSQSGSSYSRINNLSITDTSLYFELRSVNSEAISSVFLNTASRIAAGEDSIDITNYVNLIGDNQIATVSICTFLGGCANTLFFNCSDLTKELLFLEVYLDNSYEECGECSSDSFIIVDISSEYNLLTKSVISYNKKKKCFELSDCLKNKVTALLLLEEQLKSAFHFEAIEVYNHYKSLCCD